MKHRPSLISVFSFLSGRGMTVCSRILFSAAVFFLPVLYGSVPVSADCFLNTVASVSAKALQNAVTAVSASAAFDDLMDQIANTPVPLTAEPASSEERHYDFTLGFAGDINFADDYIPMQFLAAIGSENIADGVDPAYIEIMNRMDLMWINNEFTYSTRGEPLPGKAFTFRSDPAHVSYLHDLGVDIVGLANNHSFDYGEESFLDTLATLEEAQIPYVGAGRTIQEAAAPVYLETSGFTIAYVAASCAEDYVYTPEATDTTPGILLCKDMTRFLDSIRTAAENADYVIALPHWGTEHTTWLQDIQRDGARACIDAGADVVIGAHPHVLQGIEYYNGKPILYSLGNFWFDSYDIDTVVAALHFTGTTSTKDYSLDAADIELIVYPGTQTGIQTWLAYTEDWKDRILRYLETISYDIQIDEEGIVHPADQEP